MKKTIVSLLSLAVLFGLGAASASADVPSSAVQNTPGMINYQGMLANPAGGQQPYYVDGPYIFDIRLYREISGGTVVWGGTYSTYVKSGYFNIMLGGDSGAPLASGTPTYTHNELWKALWPDPTLPADQKNVLFLGITPYQDANGIDIPVENRAELAPRQNLLAAPYAFRAQTAEYASQSISDFVANGTLSGAFLNVGGGGLGDDPVLLTYMSGEQKTVGLGNDVFGSKVSIVARDVDITAGLGDMNLSSLSKMTLKTEGNNGTSIAIEAKGTASVKGMSGVTINGDANNVNLQGAKIRGQNNLEWSAPSSPSSYCRPFALRQFTVIIASGQSSGSYDISAIGFGVTDYSAAITAVRPLVVDATVGDALSGFFLTTGGSGTAWKIYIERDTPISSARSYKVDVLFINKHLIDDTRQ